VTPVAATGVKEEKRANWIRNQSVVLEHPLSGCERTFVDEKKSKQILRPAAPLAKDFSAFAVPLQAKCFPCLRNRTLQQIGNSCAQICTVMRATLFGAG